MARYSRRNKRVSGSFECKQVYHPHRDTPLTASRASGFSMKNEETLSRLPLSVTKNGISYQGGLLFESLVTFICCIGGLEQRSEK